MPAREPQTWCGLDMRTGHRRQVRMMVRARSIAAALRALDAVDRHVSRNHFNDYWSATGSEHDLAAADAWPEGTVLWTPDRFGQRNWRPWNED